MFYLADIEDYVRVEPKHFGLATKEAVAQQLNESYVDSVSKDLGYVVTIVEIEDVGEGIIIPGDGSTYYNSKFRALVWKPELHELVYGTIAEITTFGAFMDLGTMQGMIHISQTMDDYVSLNKTGTLSGKSSKKSLGPGDNCVARIVAISYKMGEPRLGITMRQPGLGKLEWLDEKKRESESKAKKATAPAKGGKKK